MFLSQLLAHFNYIKIKHYCLLNSTDSSFSAQEKLFLSISLSKSKNKRKNLYLGRYVKQNLPLIFGFFNSFLVLINYWGVFNWSLKLTIHVVWVIIVCVIDLYYYVVMIYFHLWCGLMGLWQKLERVGFLFDQLHLWCGLMGGCRNLEGVVVILSFLGVLLSWFSLSSAICSRVQLQEGVGRILYLVKFSLIYFKLTSKKVLERLAPNIDQIRSYVIFELLQIFSVFPH